MLDKIIVFGDSIAYGKWDSRGGWVARLRRHIDEKLNLNQRGNHQVFNLSIPGELAISLADRIESELIPRTTTDHRNIVIIATGINDSCHNNESTSHQTPVHGFKKSINKILTISQRYTSRTLCLGLTPVNPSRSFGMLYTNQEVKKYDTFLTEICRELSIPKIELFDDLMSLNFPDLLTDSAHPNDQGHQIIATKVIDFLNQQQLLND